MFDIILRPIKDGVVHPIASALAGRVSPNVITAVSLLFGLASAVSVGLGEIGVGLILWIINRVTDGLDGAVARIAGQKSDLGGYLDIMCDFAVYAAVPIGFAVGTFVTPGPLEFLSLAALLAAFYVNAGSWMYLSAILEKRTRIESQARSAGVYQSSRGGSAEEELTSVTMPEGLIGGTETVVFFTLFFIFPRFIVYLFAAMALLTLVTAAQRVIWAFRRL